MRRSRRPSRASSGSFSARATPSWAAGATRSEALGPNGRLMVDLVPELKLIIGEQPPVPELPPQDAQRRFQLVFRRFLGVFARRSIRWRCSSTTCNGSTRRRSICWRIC